jgi:HK97 family phage portal protein
MPWEVNVIKYKGSIWYEIPGQRDSVPAYDMLHMHGLGFDGLIGRSPIRMQAENLGINLGAQRFGKKFFDNGAHVGGAISTPNKLSDGARKHVIDSWKFKHGGVDNVGSTALLEEGLRYERIGIPPEEAQFLQTRQYGRSEVAGFYRVPPHMIADLEHATFSNIEHQDLSYVKHSLVPWLVGIEQEYDRKLFRDNEKDNTWTKHNLNALLRGDTAARGNFYEKLHKLGALSSNEIRELEEMNGYQGGERYYVQANNMVPVDKIDEFLMAKQPAAPTTKNSNGNGETDK